MDILSIEEYESLTNTPKEIRGHLFSLYDTTIIQLWSLTANPIIGFKRHTQVPIIKWWTQ